MKHFHQIISEVTMCVCTWHWWHYNLCHFMLLPKLPLEKLCTVHPWALLSGERQWRLQLPPPFTGRSPAPITPEIEDKDLWRLEIICHADWTSSSTTGWHTRDDQWLTMHQIFLTISKLIFFFFLISTIGCDSRKSSCMTWQTLWHWLHWRWG